MNEDRMDRMMKMLNSITSTLKLFEEEKDESNYDENEEIN